MFVQCTVCAMYSLFQRYISNTFTYKWNVQYSIPLGRKDLNADRKRAITAVLRNSRKEYNRNYYSIKIDIFYHSHSIK